MRSTQWAIVYFRHTHVILSAIDKAIEQLGVLIALRKAPEPAPQQGEKITLLGFGPC